MTEECACTSPTGSRGEALTFTRASAGTCTKGPEASGIDNGDLVYCSTDQPRVMRGGTGAGSKGLLVEVERTNYVLRSQEMENAAWLVLGSTPVVRQDLGVAPDGTTTADAVHFPAVADGSRAAFYQGSGGSNPEACSVYLKSAPPADGGVAVAGTIDLTANVSATPCVSCSYNPNTWTRCEFNGSGATYMMFLGNLSAYGACAAGARNAADVYVWGAQCEAGEKMSSYIPTTSASATRSEETASFTLPQTQSTSAGYSVSAKFTYRGYPTTGAPSSVSGPVSIGADSTNRMRNTLTSTGSNCVYLSTGGSITAGATVSLDSTGADNRKVCVLNGTGAGLGVHTNTTNSVTGTATNTSASAWSWDTIKFQSEWTGTAQAAQYRRPNGVVKEVCVNNAATKCQNL